MDGVKLVKQRIIGNSKGNIYHFIKNNDNEFNKFGECYFSFVNNSEIKGWKKHNKMILNIVVPLGKIKFVIYNSETKENFEVTLSSENYQRLTVFPGLWVAFKGLSELNMLVNLASIEHDPNESENIQLFKINYNW